jgi:2-polyprenyl-6-methoxyphenol hydroxylase-like FAD-dependent oxidoreductase
MSSVRDTKAGIGGRPAGDGLDCDVLVVGAGPTGLMLANQLARRGVRTLIIDRHLGPAQQSRALGVQARTLEIYAQLGIVDRALELGKIGTGANLWSEGRRIGRVDLGDAGRAATPYPYILVLGQDDNEHILGDRLRDWHCTVRWNTELTAIEQHADHAVAMLRDADGAERSVSAAWVAGCDGARSAVRELNGISFPGAPYEHVFFVADVEATGSMVPDQVNVYLWKQGFHLFFPMRGADHWRIVGILPPQLRGVEGLDFDRVVPSVRGEAGETLAFKSCSWFSTYRIHHRSAARFRDRRCFLLGDAAHIHSPVGAQGMNTGLQDAYNLGWKLALVVAGKAHAALLDSYESERLPVARRLLATTDRAFRPIVSDSRLAGLLRTRVMARVAGFAMRRAWVQRIAFRTVSQTGIHYRRSRLSAALDALPQAGPQAGDRFPWLKLRFGSDGQPTDAFEKLDDTGFNLILIGQTERSLDMPELDGLLRVHTIEPDTGNRAELARAGIPELSFYLLRPDGHIVLSGTRFDARRAADYLRSRLGMRLRGTAAQSETRRSRKALEITDTDDRLIAAAAMTGLKRSPNAG